MPRTVRYIIPNLAHHVLQRGNNRQNIFFDKKDRVYFLSKMKEISEKEKVLIGAYCLMTNHIHLLLYPKIADGMIKMLKLVAQFYTQCVNRRYRRTGKLWENRYKMHLVDPDYEWVVARYIERNPIRANMVKNATDYQYSSARAHLLGYKDIILTKNIIKSDRKAYFEFFNESESDTKEHLAQIRAVIQQQKVLGSLNFIKRLEDKFNVCFRIRRRGRPLAKKE